MLCVHCVENVKMLMSTHTLVTVCFNSWWDFSQPASNKHNKCVSAVHVFRRPNRGQAAGGPPGPGSPFPAAFCEPVV